MLRSLQHLLEGIYDTRSGHDVERFLLTQRHQLPLPRQHLAAEEELVLVTEASDTFLGVFIDGAVLQRLERHNPLHALDGNNLGDFWTALEGVSHFSYLMWNAAHDRGVSQLELELQAEVDKYVASFWLLRAQNPGHLPVELRHVLFEKTRVNTQLEPARQHLYAAASRYAARFCARLESTLGSERRVLRRAAVTALRRFYRLGSTGKQQHIAGLAA